MQQRDSRIGKLGESGALTEIQRKILAARPGRTLNEIIEAGTVPEGARRQQLIDGLRDNYRDMSGIEDWTMTLDAYKPKTESERSALRIVKQKVQEWPRHLGSSIVLYGKDHGPGKTHLGVGYVIAVLNKPRLYRARWWRTADLLHGLELKRFDEESPLMEETRTAPLLVLDDINSINIASNRLQWVVETLYRIIDARYQRKLATVVTTNKSRPELEALFGGAITDRLPEHWWVEITGPSGRAERSNYE